MLYVGKVDENDLVRGPFFRPAQGRHFTGLGLRSVLGRVTMLSTWVTCLPRQGKVTGASGRGDLGEKLRPPKYSI